MLQKYLDLIKKAVEKLTSLGGADNTWGDYFQTVGFEFMVLLLGIAYIAAVVLIIAVPTVGLVKTTKAIKVRDTFCNLRVKAGKLCELYYVIDDFVDLVDSKCIVNTDCGKIYKDDKETRKAKAAVNSDPDNGRLKAAFHKILLMMQKYNIDTSAFAKDVTDTSFEFNLRRNDADEFKWTNVRDMLMKQFPEFDGTKVIDFVSSLRAIENGETDSYISKNISKADWNNYGDFNTLGKLGKTSLGKFIFRYVCKLIGACVGVLIVYAIFVIPLILMLFK